MLRNTFLRLPAAFALAFVLGLAGLSSQAVAGKGHATIVWMYIDDNPGDGIGDAIIEEQDGKYYGTMFDEDGNVVATILLDSDPNPEGGSNPTTNTQTIKDAIALALQNGGGSIRATKEFFETPFGKALVETGKTGSIVPYHNPVDSLTRDFEGNYGGGKGIDLNGGSIAEQIKNQSPGKKKGKKDDDGDGGPSPGSSGYDQFGGASADLDLVNPVPVDRPVAKSLKKKVRQTSPQAADRGLPTALARGSILDGGPSLLPTGPSAAGTPLVHTAGSPLSPTLR